VQVVDGVEREIKHDDVVNFGNVETPCCNIGANHVLILSGAKRIKVSLSLAGVEIAVVR